ncbi:MAG TPA: outer membrane protein transport protein [Nitrospira sp.]|nr:outer membrane protein transport protein [Nitrospira sp.]MCW5793064.1 outer membrane protein transport protein [Nitrospira sp.]HMU29523.1 outer membrane protein transport protein [Nitrospira sp.]HMV55696.1 outer membrane protein transport protein [Nitrospira sp.]HMW88106.1 outer membrane protein transport protein [Nitrospira sp.]
MLFSRRFRIALVLSLVLLPVSLSLSVTPVQAQTPRLQGQSASAAAMGNAFVAQADDPSALHYNPAGMTQLHGFQTLFGTSLIGGTTQFTGPSGAQATGDRNGSLAYPPPGHVYLVANLKDLGFAALGDFSAGIGLNNPFGSLTRYPNDGPFRSALTFTTLPLLDIKPTIAYKLNDQLSFGLGADIYTFSGLFGEGHLEQKSVWPGGLGIPAGSLVEINGSDTTAGFNVSLLYTPYRNSEGKPLVNIGMVYRSQATFHLTGNFLANGTSIAGTAATFVLPQVFSGGIAVWPVRTPDREWKLEFDVDYVGWKSNRTLDIHLTNGTVLPFPQNWQSGYTAMVGTEYRWLRLASLPDWDVALRAGYMNQQTQVPDRTFNPGVPSANTHIPSVGIGFACHEHGYFLGLIRCGELGIGPLKPKLFAIDLSYQAAFYEVRTVTGNQNPTVNGRYDTLIHAGSLSLRFNY